MGKAWRFQMIRVMQHTTFTIKQLRLKRPQQSHTIKQSTKSHTIPRYPTATTLQHWREHLGSSLVVASAYTGIAGIPCINQLCETQSTDNDIISSADAWYEHLDYRRRIDFRPQVEGPLQTYIDRMALNTHQEWMVLTGRQVGWHMINALRIGTEVQIMYKQTDLLRMQ